MKKAIAVLIASSVLLSACAAPAAAGDTVSSLGIALDGFKSAIACFWHRIENACRGVNETELPAPAPLRD